MLAVAAGLTKYEGIVTAVIVFFLVGARWLSASRRGPSAKLGRPSRRRGIVAATACAFGVVGVLAWPVAAAVRRATEDDYLTGQRVGSFLSRAGATWHAMTGNLHLAGLTLGIGIVAALVLGHARRSIGFGSDGWIWVLGTVEALAIAAAYIVGTNQAKSWLAASIGRTTLFANCLGLALVAWWCVIGIAVTVAPPDSPEGGDRPPDIDDRSSQLAGGGVDAGVPAVLHPGA